MRRFPAILRNWTQCVSGVIHPPATYAPQEWQAAKLAFTEEVRTLAEFQHLDIVSVLGLFEENGTAYMVMERLNGQSLGDRLMQGGPLNPAAVEALALCLPQALKVLHDAQLLHRDLKPDSIFLEGSGRVVLVDFGSARRFESGQTARHTRLVTPGYAPMEQYGSAARFGPYTDIYSLGASLWAQVYSLP